MGKGTDDHWMTANWTMQERLAALANFRPIFEHEGFVFGEAVPGRPDGDLITLGWFHPSEDAARFIQMAYDYGWVRMFDWAGWRATAEGTRLMDDPEATAQATADDLQRILTTCIRADRFCEGYLADAFQAGLIGRVVARAAQLCNECIGKRMGRMERALPVSHGGQGAVTGQGIPGGVLPRPH